MKERLEDVIVNGYLKSVLENDEFIGSKHIVNFDPIIERLIIPVDNEFTLYLHKVKQCEEAYMHSHSYDIGVLLLKGSQKIEVGYSLERGTIPKTSFTHYVKEGDYYEITDSNIFHKTTPTSDYTYSAVIVGNRRRERRSSNNEQLTKTRVDELTKEFITLLDNIKK